MWNLLGNSGRHVIVLLGFGIAAARADVIAIRSGSDLTGTTEWNNRTGADVAIDVYPEPIWKAPVGGAKWISYGLTGPGQNSVASTILVEGVVTGPPTASFYATFFLPNPSVSGLLHVWADDTAAVFLDGIMKIDITSPVARATYCAQAPVSCTPEMGGSVDLSGLGAGLHTVEIQAWQIWGDTFGVLYEGNVSVAAVPEPASFFLLLPVVAGVIAWGKRRSRV
jgi:hypothetical protein